METVRKCTKCNESKAIEEFSFADKKRGYRRHECKGCETERKNGWYNANHARETHKRRQYAYKNPNMWRTKEVRERNAEYQKRYRDRLKAIVHAAYGNVCACCGESEPKFLTIDHVNNDGYAMRKYKGHPFSVASFHKWIIDNGFPKEFQLLCMNCNWGKSMNGGICPHKEGSTTISQESTAKWPEAHRTHTMGDDMVSSTEKSVAANEMAVRN